MKRAEKSEEGRKGFRDSFRVKNWGNRRMWETEDKEKGLLRHQFQTNNMNTISTNYDYWNRCLIVLLLPWFKVWFGFVNVLPSLYILFSYYAKSTLSNHTFLIQYIIPYSVQFSSVAQLCPTLCDPMNCSTPGLPIHHQLLDFTQTHIHGVSDAIQPSHPLLSPSPPAPNPSQHQSLFQWVNSSHEVTKVLEFQL